ncbi:hypothetical protein HID58_095881 [Brassica napus]|uniref:Uncharacterized protein n=1 Tax=Brassica napus TaxID=3708 RepID=A0ABQ7X4G6_BRANA|nr:hypothetical protein HID58_095881 [Brassica napus]
MKKINSMASSKGKGILLEEDDDEPIQLPDQADEHLIREYHLLIVAMPEQWAISEKITAYDLGNVCFLFNLIMRKILILVTTGNARVIDETTYRSYKEGTSSYSRVKQSSHSSRVNRATNPRNSRYNPYSYEDIKTLVKSEYGGETAQTLEDKSSNWIHHQVQLAGEATSLGQRYLPLIDINVIFRSNSSTRTLVSYVEATTEDLIPPYNALNAAMNECDNDNEEGDAADADMEEPTGNELMIMEEMTCWEKIL